MDRNARTAAKANGHVLDPAFFIVPRDPADCRLLSSHVTLTQATGEVVQRATTASPACWQYAVIPRGKLGDHSFPCPRCGQGRGCGILTTGMGGARIASGTSLFRSLLGQEAAGLV